MSKKEQEREHLRKKREGKQRLTRKELAALQKQANKDAKKATGRRIQVQRREYGRDAHE